VDVIFDAVDREGFATNVLQHARHIGVSSVADFRVFEKLNAVLRLKTTCRTTRARDCGMTGGNCYAPLGLCPLFVYRPRAALVPRLPWAGLRQAFGLKRGFSPKESLRFIDGLLGVKPSRPAPPESRRCQRLSSIS
jgi:hypothetical protein